MAVAVSLGAAIRVSVACQLAVGIEALADGEAERSAFDLAVSDCALRDAPLCVPGVAGAADQVTAAILLFVGGHLPISVVAVGDFLI